jgi:hypothetical protein
VFRRGKRTNEAEAAWEKLGLHLGFASSRPDHQDHQGPDNLWALSTTHHAVIELKTGCTTSIIAKKDIDQLGGSVRWDEQQYPEVTQRLPVMLHPSRILDPSATPVPGMRVISETRLDQLKTAITTFASALAEGRGRWADEQAVAVQLAQFNLTGATVLTSYSDSPTTNR